MPSEPNQPNPPENKPHRQSTGGTMLRLGLVGLVPLCLVAAFAYTGGWLSPHKLTQERVVSAFEATNGQHPGFRRNHSKGICATGWFDSNGSAAELSKAALFAPGRYPVIGRIAFAGGMPFVPDNSSLVRSLALRIMPAGAEEWRTGMINIPVFPFSNAEAFYQQMVAAQPDPATGKPDPDKMRAFVAAHPSFATAGALIKARQISSGFVNTRYNSLDTFLFVAPNGAKTPVRWSARPLAPFIPATQDGKLDNPNALFDGLISDVATHPSQWQLVLTIGQPGDPVEPNLPWPAQRREIVAGVVTVDQVESEDDGPCTDTNFDPTVLPSGIETSADGIPSARSAAYARSFRLREKEHGNKPSSAITVQDVRTGGKS